MINAIKRLDEERLTDCLEDYALGEYGSKTLLVGGIHDDTLLCYLRRASRRNLFDRIVCLLAGQSQP
ncbi:hypothetical protein [Methylovulum psychrotolerans]|uniref:Uncharacterized protein n=1 Tax=Methylovulum psychrotolerans TaxID=1704499 RepID=A0A2S5CJC4_9GAMM|nr:hypothetical protein [Methylovulum psychrotolerans]POZ50913.1 hypothetical protein AADEFJLK_03385 [Methylovulum psychrotolerans]